MKAIDDKTLALLTPMGDDHAESAPPAEPVGDLTDDERAAGFWWGPSGDDDASDVLLSRDGRSLARANERRWEVFEAPWNAKNPSPIAWGSEHSRRENRAAAAREARARKLLRPPPAALSGLRVAGLLAAVEAVHAECCAAGYGSNDVGRCLDLIRAHLGEPTPEERAAAEVLALDPTDAFGEFVGGLLAELIGEFCAKNNVDERTARAWFARMALAGILACDAKGGA